MSLSEANTIIKKQQSRISDLENIIRERDSEIEQLKANLDMTRSILSFHDLEHKDPNAMAASPGTPKPGATMGGGDQRTSVFKQRGIGISAEPTANLNLHDIKLIRHDKSNRVKELIKGAIEKNDFLKKLDNVQISDMVDCMEPRVSRLHESIIKEGEVGNEMFVIEEGNVEVFKGSGKPFRVMKPGQLFGELAILYNCTRTASIRSVSDCKLWVIERKVFQNVMMKSTIQKQENHMRALRRCNLLSGHDDDTLKRLADTLEERQFLPGEFIIRHGFHGNCAYFIVAGECDVQRKTDTKFSATIHNSAWFADETLRDQECTLENVVVSPRSPCTCLILNKDSYIQAVASAALNNSQESPPKHPHPISSVPRHTEFDRTQLSPDDFDYVATLGVGGFGRVELVKYKQTGGASLKTYAMKTLKKRHIVETRQQEHVMNEKNIMLSCRSPFIVSLFATFKDSKYLYMVFEACLGGELWTILRDYSHFDDGTTRFYLACVLEAFEYLHGKGIIYRDLKPENLLLDSQGYAKLCDFGFSKVIGNQKTWTFCGTPEYVPPEIILNKGHDFAADYWSIGILMFELLTGNPPFVGSDPMKTYNIILKGIDVIHFPSKKISRSANQLIRRLCKPNPAERLGAPKGGIKEIKRNKWFEGFNWDGVANRKLVPPIMKNIASPLDTSNFDRYERTNEAPPPDDLTGWDRDF
ncbi:cGMP-dependent protein kinase 1-like [Convolutriloba macropyga]|uniref:cGMP-dependent protein kinase 1-like n=1 Tax=Convolutriloba macropyga TaxID=536237 RepID=UPI003F527DDB